MKKLLRRTVEFLLLVGIMLGGSNLIAGDMVYSQEINQLSSSESAIEADGVYRLDPEFVGVITIGAEVREVTIIGNGLDHTHISTCIVVEGDRVDNLNLTIKDISMLAPENYHCIAFSGLGGSTHQLFTSGESKLVGSAGKAGVFVPSGMELIINTIDEIPGAIQVYGGYYSAAIGGGWGAEAGKITIEGGVINAIGGDQGAGIGGVDLFGFDLILIRGGVITAQGGFLSPGIGASTGRIIIDEGDINATGGEGGAGIGGSTDVEVIITGGIIDATGGFMGAGIGGGQMSGRINITIEGGQITALGKGGAGIGLGANSSGGIITISGGEIKAFGEYTGSGIGANDTAGEYKIIITGGVIEASSSDGTGIGGGRMAAEDDIMIIGGNILAKGGLHSAGIGGECFYETNGTINIKGGEITAIGGDFGAGIGGNYNGFNMPPIINIDGGNVTAIAGLSAAAIGGAYQASGGNITISSGNISPRIYYESNEGENGAGIGGGYLGDGGNVKILGGYVNVICTGGAAIGAGAGGIGGSVFISGENTEVYLHGYPDIGSSSKELYGGTLEVDNNALVFLSGGSTNAKLNLITCIFYDGIGMEWVDGKKRIFIGGTFESYDHDNEIVIKVQVDDFYYYDITGYISLKANGVEIQSAQVEYIGNLGVAEFRINPTDYYGYEITYEYIEAENDRYYSNEVLGFSLPARAHTAYAFAETLSPAVGADNPITLTIKNSFGNTDTAFNGAKNVSITGVQIAPNGSYGSFNGQTLEENSSGAGQVVSLNFINGIATANLNLNKSDAQIIGFSIATVTTPGTNILTIIPTQGIATAMTVTQNIAAPATNGGNFTQQPRVTLKDAYGNICTNDNATVVTADKEDAGNWTLIGTATATASSGVATFVNLGGTNAAQVNNAQLGFTSGVMTKVTSVTLTLPARVASRGSSSGSESKVTEDGVSTITVEVNNDVVERKIDEAFINNTAGSENVIQVSVSDPQSVVVKVELTGDIVKKLEENSFDVSIKWDTIEYVIPAEEFTISKVAEDLGVLEKNLKDIKIEIQITKLDQTLVAKYNGVVKGNGAELVFPPIQFKVVAKITKTDGTIEKLEISKFSNYVKRVMEIPVGIDPSKITTGIVFNPDGTYSHVPTEVFPKDNNWYAKLNALTNSHYSVIWNPVMVKSVENHWSKDTVNDMASRLVVFNVETFSPDKAITRADSSEYIVRALGLYKEGSKYENKFKDVSAKADRTLAILIASEYGIVAGYPDGTFRPDALITREEAMTMFQRAMKVTKLVGLDVNVYQSFRDHKQVSNWVTSYVEEVLSAHVFNGKTATTISPKSNLTYAEAAQAIKNLLVESKLINR